MFYDYLNRYHQYDVKKPRIAACSVFLRLNTLAQISLPTLNKFFTNDSIWLVSISTSPRGTSPSVSIHEFYKNLKKIEKSIFNFNEWHRHAWGKQNWTWKIPFLFFHQPGEAFKLSAVVRCGWVWIAFLNFNVFSFQHNFTISFI